MDDHLAGELKAEQKELLKEIKSLRRRARFAEFVGLAMILPAALSLLDNGRAAIAVMGLGLMIYMLSVRYFCVAATIPATRFAIGSTFRQIQRLHGLSG